MSALLKEGVEYVSTQTAIPMRRVWAMPHANTFSIPPIRSLVKSHLAQSKVSVDPFARNKRWATYTNDLNPATAAEFHVDVLDFLKHLREERVAPDLVIFDPPYSPTQIKLSYQSIGLKNENSDFHRVARWTNEKEIIAKILAPRGVVLSFGWNSNGMGHGLGFKIEEIILVAHGAGHNDTICTVERKVVSAQVEMFSLADAPHNTTPSRTEEQ